jgi:hypothetical protein
MVPPTPRAFFVPPISWQRTTLVRGDDRSPYLLRGYLSPHSPTWRDDAGLPAVFLHFFYRSDADRELHCHPWNVSYSLILRGGYEEERLTGGEWDPERRLYLGGRLERRIFRPGAVNRIDRYTFHRVTLLEPERGCLTLFFAGRRVPGRDGENWGFIARDGSGYETASERDRRIARERGRRAWRRLSSTTTS